MSDTVWNLIEAISDVEGIPPEQKLGAIRELVRLGTTGDERPRAGAFGPETIAWFERVADTRPLSTTASRGGAGDGGGPPPEDPPPPPPPGCTILGPLGTGGMGEVWEVLEAGFPDPRALKTIKRAYAQSPVHLALFDREIRVTDTLQHRGVPPISTSGRLPDGRPYYIMRRYQGKKLDDLLKVLPAERDYERVRPLVVHLRDVADVVGFAHGRGIVHRDLKPENVYLGETDLVVLDWGIATRLTRAVDGGFAHTRDGAAGTKRYIAPEAEAGDAVGPPADVYAIGQMVLEVLNGAGHSGPPELRDLRAIGLSATRHDPTRRPRDAGALRVELDAWLDRAARREHALALVAQADGEARAAEHLLARAAQARERAEKLAAGIQAWQPSEVKLPAWEAEDQAAALERRASLHLVEQERLLNATFTHAPQLPEAHARLAAIYRRHHEAAEAERDVAAAERWEALLRVHDRGDQAAYLRGDGALTLVTEPPGARATLHRYVPQARRLVPELVRELGETPIVEVAVPHGSYVVELSLPGHVTVRHPVYVARLEHVDGVAPGESAPRPIVLPREGELADDDCVITPGWTFTGWDREAANPPPDGRVWVEGFVMKRFPVTNGEYVAFLNAMLAEGREEEALRWAPRERGSVGSPLGRLLYGLGAEGFYLTTDPDGTEWSPHWPVIMLDWDCASAYAVWLARWQDRPWRLPDEAEWERAARGADKRHFPWGDHFDACFALTQASRAPGVRVEPGDVRAFPMDESPFGVRTLGGGVREFCRNRWGASTEAFSEAPAVRGGTWANTGIISRIGTRSFNPTTERAATVGFRVVYGGGPTAG